MTDAAEVMRIIDEFQRDIEEEKTLPLRDYERKLNLSYQTLMKKAFA